MEEIMPWKTDFNIFISLWTIELYCETAVLKTQKLVLFSLLSQHLKFLVEGE